MCSGLEISFYRWKYFYCEYRGVGDEEKINKIKDVPKLGESIVYSKSLVKPLKVKEKASASVYAQMCTHIEREGQCEQGKLENAGYGWI